MLPIIPPRAPESPVPANACDSHAHVFGPYDQYPPAADRTYESPDLPAPAYLEMLDAIGFARGVLVRRGLRYRHRPGCTPSARALLGTGRCRPRPRVSHEELAAMHASGVGGRSARGRVHGNVVAMSCTDGLRRCATSGGTRSHDSRPLRWRPLRSTVSAGARSHGAAHVPRGSDPSFQTVLRLLAAEAW